MARKTQAKKAEEFDARFDKGEDIHDLIDITKATIERPGRKDRVTLDISHSLLKEIDDIRRTIGIDRVALIKVWLYERVKQERDQQRTTTTS
jgi:hypothetical protein